MNPETNQLLQLDQILTTVETVPLDLKSGWKLGDEINRICYLFTLISAQTPLGVTLRLLSRPVSTVTAVNQLTGPGRLVQQGSRLAALPAIVIQGGWDPVTLEPLWSQAVDLKNTDQSDADQALTVRFWQPGSSLTPAQIFSGPLGPFIRHALIAQRGSPAVYAVPTKISEGRFDVGDLVSWTDNSIPTASGRGISSARHMTVGRDSEFWSGDQTLSLTPDALNDMAARGGVLAPALLVTRAQILDALGTVVVNVSLLGANTFDITGDNAGVWQQLADDGGRVRVVCQENHNPVGERPGYLEADAQVVSVTHDGTGSWMTLAVNLDWERGGFDLSDIFVEGSCFILLQDWQTASANPEGVPLTPDSYQLTQGNLDAAWIAPGDATPQNQKPFGGHYTTIDDS